MRILVGVLLEKEVKLEGVQSKVVYNNCVKIAKIVKHLFDNPQQIPEAEVTVLEGCLVKSSKTKRGAKAKEAQLQALNEDLKFHRSEVKTLGDVPVLWIWGFLRKHTPGGILDRIIQLMSARSGRPVRLVLGFDTGSHGLKPSL